jgi:ATP-dependent DNA helicase DinG
VRASLSNVVETVFGDDGALANAVPGYEARTGQQRMAAAVAKLIEEGGTLIAEAGTGTGKTLAYLVPAILSRQRVLVSTGTKNLQEQIFFKDLPALRDALGIPFTATLMKGRANYLCLHRWEAYKDGVEGNIAASGRLIESRDRLFVPVIDEWLGRTQTGDRAELAELPEHLPLWNDVAAEAGTCLGSDCPRYGDCFVTLMRQRAAEADVVIVNHHLLCADASVRQSVYGEVIPTCPTLVVDEAHQLEDVATQYFGLSVSTFRVDDLVRDARRLLGSRAMDEALAIAEALERVDEEARLFFDGLQSSSRANPPGSYNIRRPGQYDGRARYTSDSIAPHVEPAWALAGALDRLEGSLMPRSTAARSAARQGGSALDRSEDSPTDPESDEDAAAIRRRAGEIREDLRRLLRADDPDFVYFLETRARGLFVRAAPVNVSHIVREAILDRFRSVLLTSATLAVDESFEYVRRRLGLQKPRELRVASEFDYAAQSLLYLPRRMPAPNTPEFAAAAGREAIDLLRRSRGRAFVLFTSHAALRTVEPLLRMALPYPVFVQGAAPRSRLVEEFRQTPGAVLLGTSSFWQGVDVVGDALSCVIIDRLPFASPGDPVIAARVDAIRDAGGDPFADYQVPLAILALLQGLGRLIRHRTDRGVLAVLDPRLRTMAYGRRFLASLPPAPVTHDLDAVDQYFK